MFKAVRLAQGISYAHPNFWGRKSSVELHPGNNTNAWVWSPDGGPPVSIDSGCVTTESRRMQLSARNQKLEVFEHIGVLRFGGLLGVKVIGTGWPPYHGRAHELWNLIQPQVEPVENSATVPVYTVRDIVCWKYPDKRGATKPPRFTEIRPAKACELRLDIHIDYPGLGQHTETFILPDPKVFAEICSAHTQGWPRYTYKLARLLKQFWWPHMSAVTWPGHHTTEDALRLFALHRAQDVLGALSLLCQDGFFVGHIVSSCSGHHGDVKAVRRAATSLKRF